MQDEGVVTKREKCQFLDCWSLRGAEEILKAFHHLFTFQISLCSVIITLNLFVKVPGKSYLKFSPKKKRHFYRLSLLGSVFCCCRWFFWVVQQQSCIALQYNLLYTSKALFLCKYSTIDMHSFGLKVGYDVYIVQKAEIFVAYISYFFIQQFFGREKVINTPSCSRLLEELLAFPEDQDTRKTAGVIGRKPDLSSTEETF